jgi:hypothetical protein
LFIKGATNGGRTLGAVEFGSHADTVFAPIPIALTSRDTMEDALDAKIAANGAMDVTGVDDGFATDTGGVYYPETDSSLLQSVMNSIGSALTCQAAPTSFTDQIAAGKSVGHSIPISGKVKSAKIVLTWSSPLDAFTISSFKIVRHGKTVAKAAKVRKLKIKRTTTDTYVVVQLSRLVKGTLRFKVKAAKVGSGAPKATLTTQVSRQK